MRSRQVNLQLLMLMKETNLMECLLLWMKRSHLALHFLRPKESLRLKFLRIWVFRKYVAKSLQGIHQRLILEGISK